MWAFGVVFPGERSNSSGYESPTCLFLVAFARHGLPVCPSPSRGRRDGGGGEWVPCFVVRRSQDEGGLRLPERGTIELAFYSARAKGPAPQGAVGGTAPARPPSFDRGLERQRLPESDEHHESGSHPA